MSGHSKWSTIKRQKEATDKQRGNLFTKLGRAISVAVKEGGGVTDPEMNFKLRLAVEKARQANMPKANIERAIESGSGGAGAEGWEEVIYEGYGPAQAAVIVNVITNNKNRTLSEVRQIFDKNGGVLGQTGSVRFMFHQRGWLLVEKQGNIEELLLQIMDIDGVVDVDEADDGVDVFSEKDRLKQVEEQLKKFGLKIKEAELILKPKMEKKLSGEEAEKVDRFIEKLEDSDEVQQVFCDVMLESSK